ncbi:MAG: AAA family ATPase [Bermanella sp.]
MKADVVQMQDYEKPSMKHVLDNFKNFFGLDEMPFSLVPQLRYYTVLPNHNDCFNMLLFAISAGNGIIKVTGEVGTGKTLICRNLIKTLFEQGYYVAYLPSPRLTPIELKWSLAKELKISDLNDLNEHDLLDAINKQLINLSNIGKNVILIVDDTQSCPKDTLDEIRMLTNLDLGSKNLIQILLFGQPELDDILSKHEFRQLSQRINFSHRLTCLNKEDIDQYINHRIGIAGYNGIPVFDPSAIKYLHKMTKGIPRLINILCEKSLFIAFSKGLRKVNKEIVKAAVEDTDCIKSNIKWLV